jgi:hypothetical protein
MSNLKFNSNTPIKQLSISDIDEISGGDCRGEIISAVAWTVGASIIGGPIVGVITGLYVGGQARGYCNTSNH